MGSNPYSALRFFCCEESVDIKPGPTKRLPAQTLLVLIYFSGILHNENSNIKVIIRYYENRCISKCVYVFICFGWGHPLRGGQPEALKAAGVRKEARPRIESTLDLFPAQKSAVVSAAVEDLKAQNPDAVQASLMEANPIDVAISRLTPVVAPLVDTASTPVSASTSLTLSVTNFMTRTKDEEFADSVTGALPAFVKRILVNDLSLQLARAHANYYFDAGATKSSGHKVVDDSGKKTTAALSRQGPELCNLPFTGDVITESEAAFKSRSMTIPLKREGEDIPKMFIDASSVQNIKRSDYCLAWQVKPQPAEKEEQKPLTAAKEKEVRKPLTAARKEQAKAKKKEAAAAKDVKRKRLGVAAKKRLVALEKKKAEDSFKKVPW